MLFLSSLSVIYAVQNKFYLHKEQISMEMSAGGETACHCCNFLIKRLRNNEILTFSKQLESWRSERLEHVDKRKMFGQHPSLKLFGMIF